MGFIMEQVIHIKRAFTVTGERLYYKQVNWGNWLPISEDEFFELAASYLRLVHHESDTSFALDVWQVL